jgi:hypothetical protein
LVPEPLRGKSFVMVEACHLGDRSRADELLAPLRALGPVNDPIQTPAVDPGDLILSDQPVIPAR